MHKVILAKAHITEGKRLMEALQGPPLVFPVTAGLWHYRPEDRMWRLVIASPVVDREGSLRTYVKIAASLNSFKPPLQLSISDIAVVSPKWQQFRDVRRTVEGMARRGLDSHDAVFGDAYVYWWDGEPVERIVA